jgi:hypothetical protein
MRASEVFNSGLETIGILYKRAIEWEKRRKQRQEIQLIRFGLQQSEAEAWLENEPDFTRRIFTDLHNRRRLDSTVPRANDVIAVDDRYQE